MNDSDIAILREIDATGDSKVPYVEWAHLARQGYIRVATRDTLGRVSQRKLSPAGKDAIADHKWASKPLKARTIIYEDDGDVMRAVPWR